MNQFFTGDAATFWPAFAKAQAAFPKLTFDKAVSAGAKQYKYATLPAVFEAVRDTLNTHGFAVFHLIEGTGVKAVIAGNGGMLESGLCDLGTPNITAQVAGSAITYARRYTLTALCGIAPEEDDDAQGANQHPVNAAPKATPLPPATPDPIPSVAINEAQAIKMFEKHGIGKVVQSDGKTFAVWEKPNKDSVLTAYWFNLAGCVDTNPTDLTTAKA